MILSMGEKEVFRGFAAALLITAALALQGCASSGAVAPVYSSPAPPACPAAGVSEDFQIAPQPRPQGAFQLHAGDIIELKFFYEPRLNESVVVRLDGYISLQLVGEIYVEGMTPFELRNHLVEDYSTYIQNPEIAVIVRGFEGHKAYVGGEVMTPSIINLTNNMTPLQAILHVGGFRETAKVSSVLVISKASDGSPAVRRIDLKPVLDGEAPDNSLCLRPDDIVYVPKTFIAEANKFVREYITSMIPGTLGANFGYTIYRGRQTGTINTSPVQ